MNNNQAQVFPVYRLVAEFADGSRLTFDGFTYEQARDAMEQAQDEHGDIGWYDGVTSVYLPTLPPAGQQPYRAASELSCPARRFEPQSVPNCT